LLDPDEMMCELWPGACPFVFSLEQQRGPSAGAFCGCERVQMIAPGVTEATDCSHEPHRAAPIPVATLADKCRTVQGVTGLGALAHQ